MQSKTNNKVIVREDEVRGRIAQAVVACAAPVIETIGPIGKNVLIETVMGGVDITNDGVTIIKNLSFKDGITNSVAEVLKEASKRTNQEAGDATSTTVLLASVFFNEAESLRRRGLNQRAVRDVLGNVARKLCEGITKQKKSVETTEERMFVASVSANNDLDVAKITVEAAEAAGLDGTIFLEASQDEKSSLDIQPGFRIPNGMIFQNLYKDPSRPNANYKGIPVIIFDKKLYYADEAEHILRFAKGLGIKELTIVAKDFVGDAPNTFIANHMNGSVSLVLAKIDDDTQLDDLAVYLGGTVVSEKSGKRVSEITKDDFTVAESVFADPQKVLIKNGSRSEALDGRIAFLREELEKDKNNKHVKGRLSSLTNGIVTIKIGGRTQPEAQEKMYRFEDAISAVRAAERGGYVVGGGIALRKALKDADFASNDERRVAVSVGNASMLQIADNCDIDVDFSKVDVDKNIGLNAMTGKYEDLLAAGIIEPAKAVEMSVNNGVSAADVLASVGTFILLDHESKEE